jgi:phytoene dehydrogenase-like protein
MENYNKINIHKKINIIGAGIAGLAAGNYLQMNGYNTEIFELAANPGGLCTAWKRKGYTFDGCIHWVTDSTPGGNLHHFWEEAGVIKDTEYVTFDIVQAVEDEDGKQCKFYSDPDKLKAELLSFGPEDSELIEEFTEAVKKYSMMKYDSSKAAEITTFGEKLKMMTQMGPFLKFIKKWDISIKEYANRYKNPYLRKVFLSFDDTFSYLPFLAVIFMIGCYCGKSGYPIGGSLEFSKKIEKKYLSLGGKVNYNSKVIKILVEDGKTIGIKLESGDIKKADITISAADGYYTIYKMLEGKYINSKISSYYNGGLKTFPALMQLSLGINKDYSDQVHAIDIPLRHAIIIDPVNILKRISLKFYNFDPTTAPEGKTSLVSFFVADYAYWTELRRDDRDSYENEKKRISDEIIEVLDIRFPGLASAVEVANVATPATYARFANNWLGSYEGWIPDGKSMLTMMSKELPGLKDFYMIGQWVAPGGGLPSGVMTGRDVTQIICKKDKKEFKVII